MRLTGLKAALTAGTALNLVAWAAQAQPATPKVEEVVVTGSRVITNGNSSPTPVTVVPVEDVLRLQPSTVADALNEMPVFSGQRNQFSNPGGGTAANNGGGNSGSNNLNLRNMGTQRTLILFDGLRVPSTSTSGVVDVDMVPQMLLQRVDVVTGGASAVYGSDAVTGVVNFITDQNFNGLKANAQSGVTQRGDDRSYNAGIAGGISLLDGRAHIEGSYEYREDKGVLTKLSRAWGRNIVTTQGAGTAANPYHMVNNARANNASFGGLITNGALSGMNFTQNGVLSPFVHGAASGTNGIEIGGDGVYWDDSLKSPLKSHQLFGRLDYDVTDTIHGYVEVAGNEKINSSYTTWIALNNATLSASNPYLASAYQGQLAAAKQTSFNLSKSMTDTGRNKPSVDEQQVFVNAGLKGDFAGGYKWEMGFVHSTARLTQTNLTNLNNGRLSASLDAATDASGKIVCGVTLTNPSLYPGCVPLNPFGPTSDNPAALSYIEGQTTFIAKTQMDDISGSVSGAPFSTWAGPVTMAVSGEWRRQGYSGISNALPSDLLGCAGLRFNCTATTTSWLSTIATRSPVSQTVGEGALEFDAPLLTDQPWVQSFNLNGAVRYTDYNTSGSYVTWKVGFDWHVDDSTRLRGTVSRDIRAPTLDDLFSPTTANTGGTFADPLTGLTATNVTTISGGNPNVTAEIGDTKTLGVVFRPESIPGLSLAVDGFDISVSNAILNLLSINVTLQNACVASGGSSPYCALYIRPLPYSNTTAANNVTAVRNTVINIASQKTEGVDFEANYRTELFGRPVSLRALTTYQPHIKYIQPGLPTLDQAGVGFGTNGVQAAPVWRVTAFLHASPIDNFNVDFLVRYRTSLKLLSDPTLFSSGPQIEDASFTNMNLSYLFQSDLGQAELFFNISNLFDKQPPPAAFSGGRTNPGQQGGFVIGDDPLGRAFTFGVRFHT